MSDEIDSGYTIFQKIHQSVGMKFLGRKKLRSFTLNIFTMNKIELQNDLELFENPEIGLQLMSHDNKGASQQVHRELNRRFHNFLAGAKTLIDHTRVFIADNYSGTSIESEYLQRVRQELANDELCRFMQDLRNYTLHCELPISTMTLKFTPSEGITTRVSIHADELREWAGWSVPSKSFLEKQEKEISPLLLVSDYASKIEGFQEWIDTALEEYHQADLVELRELEKRHEIAVSLRRANSPRAD